MQDKKQPRTGRDVLIHCSWALVLLMTACNEQSSLAESTSRLDAGGSDPDASRTSELCTGNGGTLELGCPALPNTYPSAQPDWDHFAWNAFAALNWPALDPDDHNEQRGFPDLSDSFIDASSSQLTVWETYKEKREVFYNGATGSAADPGPWNQAVQYGPSGVEVPLCDDAGAAPTGRLLVQTQKPSYDSLDETIEVASEALESGDELCQGYSDDPQCGTANQAECCLVSGQVVGPRVWKGQPTATASRPVLYEVKVNYDFYDYVTENEFYLDTNTQAAAEAGTITLPWRTSSEDGPGGNNPGVTSYSAEDCVTDYYERVQTDSDLTPCPQGSVHLKAAWLLLEEEDPSQYHTAEALYFRTRTDGTTCMTSGTFGLIGLHIIQRVHQSVEGESSATPVGGTFVFATWEHVDASDGYFYANDYKGQGTEPPPAFGFYPTPEEALPVTRKFDILSGTAAVNDEVHDQLGCDGSSPSVWCNYQLIGTQFQAVDVGSQTGGDAGAADDNNDPTGIQQPAFLANLVIETNQGLQDFRGQPPLTQPNSNFSKKIQANDLNTFARDNHNMQSDGTAYNMGGCMGCHGVAQSKGYSFSFVLLGGQAGAGIDTESAFEIPPPVVP